MNRIEQLAAMAYEAGHHPTSADFADIGPAAKENLRRIVRTLYAAIMTEAAGVAAGEAPFLCCDETDDAASRTATRIANALHAKAKESAP